jgi:hypothetical protein
MSRVDPSTLALNFSSMLVLATSLNLFIINNSVEFLLHTKTTDKPAVHFCLSLKKNVGGTNVKYTETTRQKYPGVPPVRLMSRDLESVEF